MKHMNQSDSLLCRRTNFRRNCPSWRQLSTSDINIDDDDDVQVIDLDPSKPHDSPSDSLDNASSAIDNNNVYIIVDKPQHKKTFNSKWIFKKKRGMRREVKNKKTKLVAKGFTQEEEIHSAYTFAPTVRFERIRLLLVEVAAHELHTAEMDATTAFLYVDPQEEVYLDILEGMFDGKVPRLWKALYGLNQIPKMSNLHIDNILDKFGRLRLTTYFFIYIISEGENRVILGLYVDDMLMLMDKLGAMKLFLHSNFRISQ